MELYKLYQDCTGSVITLEKFEEEVTYLTGLGWSGESIFFSINFCSRYYREDLKESLTGALDKHKSELLKYYSLAKAKKDIQTYEEGAEKYDPKNKPKGNDKPSWFRKSFDKHLFS